MIKRISITGPESTGKSKLAVDLAKHYQTVYVPEYSREYLKDIGTNYSLDDVLNIAKGQLFTEAQFMQLANQVLFCDTDPLVSKIWCNEVFSQCPEWIESKVIEHRYDMYLLCYPDIEWEPDVLRENPDNRKYLFDLYIKELEYFKFNYRVVNGKGSERLKNAIKFVNGLLAE